MLKIKVLNIHNFRVLRLVQFNRNFSTVPRVDLQIKIKYRSFQKFLKRGWLTERTRDLSFLGCFMNFVTGSCRKYLKMKSRQNKFYLPQIENEINELEILPLAPRKILFFLISFLSHIAGSINH